MAATERQSLDKTLETRYETQPEGGAFNVKDRLGNAGSGPVAGSTMPAASQASRDFLVNPNFVVKEAVGVTQMKDATGTTSKGLSRYMKGFNNRKYKR